MTNAIKLLSILPIKRPILFVTFLILILHLLYSPFYLGADNIYAFAALHIGEQASPHCILVSYFLTYPLCWLSLLTDQICWYTVYLFLINYIAVCSIFTVLTHESRQTGKYNFQALLGGIILAQQVFHHALQPNFGFYSFFGMGAGLLLVYAGCKESISKWIWTGVFLMIGAAVIRYDSCIGITPSIFALIILAFLSRREFHTYKKFILLGILIAVTILGINLAQQPLATDPLEPERNLVEENSIRILFTDYPDHSRMDKSNLYAENGASPADLFFISRAIWITPEKYTANFIRNMGHIRKMDNPSYKVNISGDYFKNMFLTRFGLTLLLFGLPAFTKRSAINKLFFLGCILAAASIVYFKGRLIPSSQGTLCYGALPLLAYFTETPGSGMFQNALRKWGQWMFLLIFIIIGGFYLTLHKNLFSPLAFPVFQHKETRSLLLEHAKKHPDQIYFMEPTVWREICIPNNLALYPKDFFSPPVYPVMDWFTRTPAYRNKLAGMNSGNDILSLLDGRVRIADNGWLKKYMEQTERYLQEEYHINAKWTKEKQLDEHLSIFRLIKN